MNLDALVGRTLGGKYRLDGMIASGGFGAVFEAVQLPLNRPVAVKVNLHGHQPAMRARFKREADVLTRLRHPGIVQLLDYGEEVQPDLGPLFYMVQEFVAGESLKALLARERRLRPDAVVPIFDELLVALAEAHRMGIVHRDIKPGNLMLALEPGGRRTIRILDFGISKATESVDDLGTLTATGALLGTPAYMAPEQCQHQPVSPATDIYAVGVLLYRMLAGALPFRASNLWGYLSQHIGAPVPGLPADVPPAFTAIVRRAMAKAPTERFGSAFEMREALLHAMTDGGIGARGYDPSRPTPPLPAAERDPGPDSAEAAPLDTRPDRWSPPSAPLPAPTFGESTTDGAMVVERPAERRPRWWVAGLAALALAGATALTALYADDTTEPDVPDRIRLSVAAPQSSATDGVDPSGAADGQAVDARTVDAAIVDAAPPVVDARPPTPRRRARTGRPIRPTAAPKAPAVAVSPAPAPAPAPSLDQLLAAFDREIGRCDCAAARARLTALRDADPPSAAVKARRYEEECQMRLPGNCRSK